MARRILHVLAPAPFGGLEQVVLHLAEGQVKRGDAVAIAAVTCGDQPSVVDVMRARGLDVHRVDVAPRAYGRERAAIAELCRIHAPQVLHTHGYRPDVVDAGVARRRRIPTVTTVHGFTGGGWRNRVYEWLQRRAFRRFDAVVAVSRALRSELEASGVNRDRLHMIPNGHPGVTVLPREAARQVLGVAPDGMRIGFVGRLTPEKGPDVFLAALPPLSDLALRASIIGSGRLRDPLGAFAATVGVADRIDWHGIVPDAGRLLPALDVLVVSSRTEGTPIIVLEAMAAGVPLVVTAVGGVPDMLSSREALLIPSESPGELARAIREAILDQGATNARARAARLRHESAYRVDPWVAQYETVYGGLDSAGGPGSGVTPQAALAKGRG